MNFTATIAINRPAADVFDYVMEVPHDAQWRSGVVEAAFTSDGPFGVGTTGFDRIEARTLPRRLLTSSFPPWTWPTTRLALSWYLLGRPQHLSSPIAAAVNPD